MCVSIYVYICIYIYLYIYVYVLPFTRNQGDAQQQCVCVCVTTALTVKLFRPGRILRVTCKHLELFRVIEMISIVYVHAGVHDH